MGTLTVWKFDTASGAAEASSTLQGLARRGTIMVRDAATVTWETGTRKPKTQHLVNLGGPGSLGGAFWGLLFGLVFFVPLLGAALGAPSGALSGSMADVGIDDTFINRIRDQVTPGTSALFLLSSDAVVDQVKDALERHGPSELLFTDLSQEQEDALREVFAE